MTNELISRTELRVALQRVLTSLESRLAAQRESGRAPATDALRGVAIEEGEAERLVEELAADLARPPVPSDDESLTVLKVADANESPLRRVRRVFRLHPVELDALVLALSVEIDPRFARLVAYLNDHVSRTRPTVGLALALARTDLNAVEFCEMPAVRHGLLQVDGDGPLSDLPLRVAPEFLPRLSASEWTERLPPGLRLHSGGAMRLDELLIGQAQRDKLTRWAARLNGGGSTSVPLVLAGPEGAGRATAVQTASGLVGRPVVEVIWAPERADRAELLGVAVREARWFDATLLVRVADSARDPELAALWAALGRQADVPIALTLPPEHVDAACSAAPGEPVTLLLEGTTIEQRERLWRKLLSSEVSGPGVRLSETERQELAARYDFFPGALARAVRRATADRAGSPEPLDFESLSRACRAVGSAAMGPIAQRLPQPYTLNDLVLPKGLLDELELAAAWMRNRRRVFEDWGFGRKLAFGRGLTALFTGGPGTGKTMTAQVLARELGLELFRVDLSRVMSKYIGETEKNLSRLFEDARSSGAILFFDEADALFGKRTEVKDAHDRYANIEIGYLLQRMEEHTGTTILATNRVGDLDQAFTRRFHFILDFPMPRPPERQRIWEGMLPASAEREPEIELDTLARDYDISGGEIRNSVLSAAFIAAEEGVPIGLRHLKRGLRRELLKTGRVLDGRQRRELEGT